MDQTVAPVLTQYHTHLPPDFTPVIPPPASDTAISPDKWARSHTKLINTVESQECRAVEAVVGSEIARDDGLQLRTLQLKFSNDELGNKIQATEELKQLLQKALDDTLGEAARVEQEIKDMDATYGKHEGMIDALTRVKDIRAQRPHRERVLDNVDHTAKIFLRELQSTLYPPRLKKLSATLDQLRNLAGTLQEDVDRKDRAMQVDAHVLDSLESGLAPAARPASSKAAGRQKAFDAVRVTPGKHHARPKTTKAWVQSALQLLHKCHKQIGAAIGLRKKCIEYRESRVDVGELGRQRLIGAIEDAEHQLEESLNELAAGEAEIDKDIEGDREEIAHILESVPQLQGPLEVAEDRLLKRARRPVPERVRDSAEKALQKEIESLRISLAKLRAKEKKLKDNLGRLMNLKKEIQQDSLAKKKTISIHRRCIDFLSEEGSKEVADADAKLAALQKVLRQKLRTSSQVFYAGDTNFDNKLNLEEFNRGLAMMGARIAPADVRLLFESLDRDNTGFLEWEELRAMV